MLFWLAELLEQYVGAFRVFEYITFRAILAALTALLIALLTGPALIRHLQQLKIGQVVRDDGPQTHLSKMGRPTMGGLMMLLAITVSTVLWGDLSNRYTWILLLVTLAFGVIGGVDDYRKLVAKTSAGLSAKAKFFWQSVIALTVALFLFFTATQAVETALLIPYLKDVSVPLGGLFVFFAFFVIIGTSNAVNLTDGLDGLAIMPIVMVAGALGAFAYLSGNVNYAEYLTVPHIAGVGEVTIFAAAIVGAGLGFLWFNSYPAEVFMGDIGSLSLGAALGTMAVLVRQEIILVIIGGIFVVETLSVILQVGKFKLTGKRMFRMAPIHHHFELKGWAEPKVVVRFWIITVILVLIGLASLKLR